MIVESIGLGIIISFLYTELVGLYTGGVIVPGYLAFFWNQPSRLIATLLIAFLSYLIVTFLSNFMIIYSRRRFLLVVIIGYLLGWIYRLFFVNFLPFDQDLRVIGYIIPGLIANDMLKQGVLKTILSLGTVTIIVRLVLLFIMN